MHSNMVKQLELPITSEKLSTAISSMRGGKSPGPVLLFLFPLFFFFSSVLFYCVVCLLFFVDFFFCRFVLMYAVFIVALYYAVYKSA